MATANPFDLLGDDDNDDPAQLIAFHEQKIAAKRSAAAAAPAPAVAKLPTKPLPPAQAVREARGGGAMARGGRGVGLRGRGGRGGGYVPNRDFGNGTADGFSAGSGGGGGGGWGEEGDRSGDRERSGYGGERGGYGGERGGYGGDRSGGYGGERGGYGGERGGYGAERGGYGGERGGYGGYRGGRRGGYGNVEEGEDGRPVRRMYERRSGTGRGFETKRDGAGRGNWGTVDDAIAQESEELVNKEDKVLDVDKENEHEKSPENIQDKEPAELENKEKEEEDKEMTLEEYEKVREEKRKALLASKPEERKVDIDKELKAMQLLAVKKGKDDVFIKLGSEKESRKQKENAERETSKKSLSINEFLKPADGGYYNPAGRGRGRGRGRGERGAGRGDFGRGGYSPSTPAPEVAIPITDPGQFPALGGK